MKNWVAKGIPFEVNDFSNYDTENVKPSYKRRRRKSGQIGQKGRKRKKKAPSLKSIPDPMIIRTLTKSKFLLGLFTLL